MNIFPAIDLIDGNVVRLKYGDYNKMTVFGNDPVKTALEFQQSGAEYLHTVDLQGALLGADGKDSANSEVVKSICKNTDLKVEIGGGIRNLAIIESYINAGIFRVILGTAAIENPEFLEQCVCDYKDKIAVGVDIKDGFVATHGWTKSSGIKCDDFIENLAKIGVKTVICTDISKDGALSGTNLDLYKHLSEKFSVDIVASGGISSINDIVKLKEMNIYGAILGKALYTGAIDLKNALEISK